MRDHPGCSFNDVSEGVTSRTQTIQKKVKELIARGAIRREVKGGGHSHVVQPLIVVDRAGADAKITMLNVA